LQAVKIAVGQTYTPQLTSSHQESYVIAYPRAFFWTEKTYSRLRGKIKLGKTILGAKYLVYVLASAIHGHKEERCDSNQESLILNP